MPGEPELVVAPLAGDLGRQLLVGLAVERPVVGDRQLLDQIERVGARSRRGCRGATRTRVGTPCEWRARTVGCPSRLVVPWRSAGRLARLRLAPEPAKRGRSLQERGQPWGVQAGGLAFAACGGRAAWPRRAWPRPRRPSLEPRPARLEPRPAAPRAPPGRRAALAAIAARRRTPRGSPGRGRPPSARPARAPGSRSPRAARSACGRPRSRPGPDRRTGGCWSAWLISSRATARRTAFDMGRWPAGATRPPGLPRPMPPPMTSAASSAQPPRQR